MLLAAALGFLAAYAATRLVRWLERRAYRKGYSAGMLAGWEQGLACGRMDAEVRPWRVPPVYVN